MKTMQIELRLSCGYRFTTTFPARPEGEKTASRFNSGRI